MTKVVLDASAIIALINSENGAEMVESVIDDAAMSTVNICEVIGELNSKLAISISKCEDIILSLISNIYDFDYEQSVIAASMKSQTKSYGLSLGDRACISLGQKLNVPIYTADKIWMNLDINAKIIVIR